MNLCLNWRIKYNMKTEAPAEDKQTIVKQSFYSDLTPANNIYCDDYNSTSCLKKESSGCSPEEIADVETLEKYSCVKRERAFSRERSFSPRIVEVYSTRRLQISLPRIDCYACYSCGTLIDLSKTIFTKQGNCVQNLMLICSTCKMCNRKQEPNKVKWENLDKFKTDMMFGCAVPTQLLDFHCKRCDSEIGKNQRIYLDEYDLILCQNCNESKPLTVSVKKELIHSDDVTPEIKIKSEVINDPPFITNIKCKFCRNLYFFKKRDLKWHLIEQHGAKGVTCTKCHRAFKSQLCLKTHIETIHERRVVYPCNVCHRKFNQKGNLLTHINTKHRKNKKYKCNFCDHDFAQKGNLLKHIDFVHKNILPFICQVCCTAYSKANSLQRHIKINHIGLV